jgi:hypothetical protein
MQVKPFYSYREVALLMGRSPRTIEDWVYKDRNLPPPERRFPGAADGFIPLADLKARWSMTNDDIAALSDPLDDSDDDGAKAASA